MRPDIWRDIRNNTKILIFLTHAMLIIPVKFHANRLIGLAGILTTHICTKCRRVTSWYAFILFLVIMYFSCPFNNLKYIKLKMSFCVCVCVR